MKRYEKLFFISIIALIVGFVFFFAQSFSTTSQAATIYPRVVIGDGASFTLSGGTLKGNGKVGSGGVVLVDKGTFTMSGGNITGGSAQYGGGVYVTDTFNFNGGTISDNEAMRGTDSSNSYYGGGIYVKKGATCTMTNGTISSNSAYYAGGVYNGGTFIMSGGTISGNNSEYYGFYNSGTFEMTGGTIMGNNSNDGTGGLCLYAGTCTMSGGTIKENKSDDIHYGGWKSIDVIVTSATTFNYKGGTIEGIMVLDAYGEPELHMYKKPEKPFRVYCKYSTFSGNVRENKIAQVEGGGVTASDFEILNLPEGGYVARMRVTDHHVTTEYITVVDPSVSSFVPERVEGDTIYVDLTDEDKKIEETTKDKTIEKGDIDKTYQQRLINTIKKQEIMVDNKKCFLKTEKNNKSENN